MDDKRVFRAEGVFLKSEDELTFGPLDLELTRGEGALVLVQDLGLMRRLMACCQGLEPPSAGRVDWWDGAREMRDDTWGEYEFLRQIGYVDRQSQLLNNLTLLGNLTLYHGYARIADGPARSRKMLDKFGLGGYEQVSGEMIPEPKRRLALYAQVFCQRPRLLLMERPAQFLDRDFDLVWDMVLNQARQNGLAYIVFDRKKNIYPSEYFEEIVTFAPGR
ncbi:hypothetical protein LJB86_00405 [Deltaproteobacteria bacterium OttesenSCG-928-M10]|nr:hypothetical protein [Deltaproteobacteria bacterium OttesenSCG-928-M10]